VRLNSRINKKPAQSIRPGDVLTIARAREVLVVRILSLPERRGSADQAQAAYEEVTSG
jgi:ribosome-associated heat shock protein Hsp15